MGEKLDPCSKLLTKGVLRPAQMNQHAVASVGVNLPLLVVFKDRLESLVGMSSALVGIPEIALEHHVLIP